VQGDVPQAWPRDKTSNEEIEKLNSCFNAEAGELRKLS
jgi:hypothetical protein